MVYILSWAFCLALLLAVYKIFLSGTTFHRFNRFLLLGFLALSAVLPLCHIETEHTDIAIANTEFVRTIETLQESHVTAVVTDVDAVQYPVQTVNEEVNTPVWPYLLVGIYLMYVLIILSGWVRSTVKMKRFLRSCRRYRLGKWIRLAVHRGLFGPFNWMNYIVVPDEERKLHSDVSVCHELAHVRNLHCIDLLVVGLCALVNPVAWLLLRELKTIHEYEADDHVLRSGRLEAKTYQLLLIKKSVGAEAYALASCLNFNLKNRIIMMKKEQTNRWRKAWLLAAIPVAGVALAMFAVPASEAKAENGITIVDTAVPTELTDVKNVAVAEPVAAAAGDTTIYKICEEVPQFPGGTGELMTYLMKNLVYPQECNAVPGFGMRVIVRVVVEKDGSLSDITVLHGKSSCQVASENNVAFEKARKAAYDEAVRVIKSMPKWTPGTIKGKAVRSYFTIPVMFRTN